MLYKLHVLLLIAMSSAARAFRRMGEVSVCVEDDASRRGADVLFYYRKGGQPRFAAKRWGAPYHRVQDTSEFKVMGNPCGVFYRRCIKPFELEKNETCNSICMPDYEPKTKTCEKTSAPTELLEKGEEMALEEALGERKLVVGKSEKKLAPEDFKCSPKGRQGTKSTPKALGASYCKPGDNLDAVDCILEHSRLVELEMNPENAGIAAPMHVRMRVIEISERIALQLMLPGFTQKDGTKKSAVPFDWLTCEEATESAIVEDKGSKVKKWKYVHAAVVIQSGLCPKEVEATTVAVATPRPTKRGKKARGRRKVTGQIETSRRRRRRNSEERSD